MTRPKLYRHYDSENNLLYIGISISVLERMQAHRCNSSWFDSITKITIETFGDVNEALSAEKTAIKHEKPKFNIRYNESVNSLDEGDLPDVMDVAQLAAAIGCSSRTVRRMLKDGQFPLKPIENTKPKLWSSKEFNAWRLAK